METLLWIDMMWLIACAAHVLRYVHQTLVVSDCDCKLCAVCRSARTCCSQRRLHVRLQRQMS